MLHSPMYLMDPIVDDGSFDYTAAAALKLATYGRTSVSCSSSTTVGRAFETQCGFKVLSHGAAHTLFVR